MGSACSGPFCCCVHCEDVLDLEIAVVISSMWSVAPGDVADTDVASSRSDDLLLLVIHGGFGLERLVGVGCTDCLQYVVSDMIVSSLFYMRP